MRKSIFVLLRILQTACSFRLSESATECVLWSDRLESKNWRFFVNFLSLIRRLRGYRIGRVRVPFNYIIVLNLWYYLFGFEQLLQLVDIIWELRDFLVGAVAQLNSLKIHLLLVARELEFSENISNHRLLLLRKTLSFNRLLSELFENRNDACVDLVCLLNELAVEVGLFLL